MESGDGSVNRELPLFPSAPQTCSVPAVGSGSGSGSGGSPQQNHQPLTIFYDGRICVSDATELQARAIITAAMREMDDRKRICSRSPAAAVPSTANEYCRLRGPPSGVSMKRSLHRFLQKRRSRVAAAMALHGRAPIQVQPLSPRFDSGQLSQTRRDVLT